MARKDWVYLNFDKPLMERVEKCVTSVYYHGVPKYPDKKQFVVKAIQKLLDLESKKLEAVS